MLFVKIFGSFRWLSFLIGAALVVAVSWVLWPNSAQNVPKNGVKTSETVKIVHDSTGIKSLRDSVAALRRHSMAVRIIRVTIRDTVHGTEEIYLDSGAVVHDTVSFVRTARDTVSVHVTDTLYKEKELEPVQATETQPWGLSVEAYYDETKKTGGTVTLSRDIAGPLSAFAYGDYQSRIEAGAGVSAEWRIFRVSALVRNYGISGIDLGYKITGCMDVRF